MTEQDVQNALYLYLRKTGVWPILPNIDCITGYEADASDKAYKAVVLWPIN